MLVTQGGLDILGPPFEKWTSEEEIETAPDGLRFESGLTDTGRPSVRLSLPQQPRKRSRRVSGEEGILGSPHLHPTAPPARPCSHADRHGTRFRASCRPVSIITARSTYLAPLRTLAWSAKTTQG